MLQRRGRPGCEGAGVVIARQYVHNACIRCPSLLLPHADAPARLPLCVPSAGGGACTLSSRVRETALARSSSIPSVVRWLWRCWLHAARFSSLTTGPRGPHVRYISTSRTPPLIVSGVPCWLTDSSGHQLSSRRGKARALRHARLLFMRSSEDYSAGVPRLLCHTCAKCWNRAKNVQGGREDVPQA